MNYHQVRRLSDQKRREGARSRYASHKEGQPVVFRMKAHFGVDSRGKLIHAVVTTPANAADSTVLPDLARERDPGMGGSGLPRPTGSQSDSARRRSRILSTALPPPRRRRSSRTGEKPHQIQSAGSGRTCNRGNQAGVRLAKVRYRGLKKNTHLPYGDLGADQFVHGAPPAIALPTGVTCPQPGQETVQTPQYAAEAASITPYRRWRGDRYKPHPA